jgi:hypothetical protein
MHMLRKILLRTVVVLTTLVTVVIALQFVASESGEVVVISTCSEGAVSTRLWVVDHDGAQWLRAGAQGARWYGRMTDNPAIHMQRGDVAADYLAVPIPAAVGAVNDLMREKYGWADSLIDLLFGGRENAMAVRLQPSA